MSTALKIQILTHFTSCIGKAVTPQCDALCGPKSNKHQCFTHVQAAGPLGGPGHQSHLSCPLVSLGMLRALGCGLCSPPNSAKECSVSCRKELAEAHKAKKPCGKCSFYLLISKTFVETGQSDSKKKRSNQNKEELMFANAEEEFFYEVRLHCLTCLRFKEFPQLIKTCSPT